MKWFYLFAVITHKQAYSIGITKTTTVKLLKQSIYLFRIELYIIMVIRVFIGSRSFFHYSFYASPWILVRLVTDYYENWEGFSMRFTAVFEAGEIFLCFTLNFQCNRNKQLCCLLTYQYRNLPFIVLVIHQPKSYERKVYIQNCFYRHCGNNHGIW